MGNDISIFKQQNQWPPHNLDHNIFMPVRSRDDDDTQIDSGESSSSSDEEPEEELERRPRKPAYTYKVLIVGRPESGKTALVNRFVKGTYTEAFLSETRDVQSKEIPVSENYNVKLNIWDILPREGYLTFFEGAAGAIVVYDCATPSELDALKWKQELDGISKESPIPIALVATKCDEPHTLDPQLDQFVKDYGFIGRYDTSAKLDTGVTQVFSDLIQHMLANDPKVLKTHKPNLDGVAVPAPVKAPPSPLTVPVQAPPHTSSPTHSPRSSSPPLSPSPTHSPLTAPNSTSLISQSPPALIDMQEEPHSEVHSIPSTVVEQLERKAEDMYVL